MSSGQLQSKEINKVKLLFLTCSKVPGSMLENKNIFARLLKICIHASLHASDVSFHLHVGTYTSSWPCSVAQRPGPLNGFIREIGRTWKDG